ncbi:MAG: STAS domain-containing protein [bacterium]
MNLSIRTDVGEDAVVVHVGGDLDVYTAPRLKESLTQAIANGGRLVLDLSEVHFIDSTALGVLVNTQQQTQSTEGELRLVVDDPYLLKIFRITGFDGVFSIFPQVADAVSGN